jgi:competence protein ComEC
MTLEDLQYAGPAPPVPHRAAPPAPLLPLAVGLIVGIVADSALTPPLWLALLPLAVGAVLIVLTARRLRLAPPQGANVECRIENVERLAPGDVPPDTGLAPAPFSTFSILHSQFSFAAWLQRFAPRSAWLAVVLAGIALGLLRHAVADRCLPADHIVLCVGKGPILAQVCGRILSPPSVSQPAPHLPRVFPTGPRTRFILDAEEIAGEDGPVLVSGRAAVVVRDALLSARVGDRVRITGWLYRPPSAQNPGAYDWALHQRRAGLHVGLSCDHAESVVVLSKSALGGWRGVLQAVRTRLRGYLLNEAFTDEDDPGAGVIAAMVLGERSAVSKAMNEAFVKTGNAHFLAASGMNVAWLALTGWGVLRLLGAHYRTSTTVVALLILSYVLVAEPQPSILRAGIVGLLACATIYVRGTYHALNSLALATVVVLMVDPMDVFRPAFQYSFLAVLALMHLCPYFAKMLGSFFLRMNLPGIARSFDSTIHDALLLGVTDEATSPYVRWRRTLAYWMGQLLALSLSAWLITAPLSCYYFNNFTPIGWLQTMLLWFIALPVTVVGYVTLLVGAVFPSSGVLLGPLLKIGTDLMTGTVHLLARLPATLVDGRSPSIWWVACTYGVLWLWVYRRHWLPIRHGFKVLLVVLVVWWAVPPRWRQADGDALNLWALSVGNGNANIIELPDGRVFVYDFGTRSGFDSGSIGAAFLTHRGIRHIEAVFVSHPNFDHFAGVESLAARFEIGCVVVNDHFERLAVQEEEPSTTRFLKRVAELGIPLRVLHGPQVFEDAGGAKIEVLWPPAADRQQAANANESSTVLRITYQGRRILLTGDIREMGMAGLLHGADPRADVLLLPHHGGVASGTAQFIEAVDPQAAIRSSGQSRRLTTNAIEQLVGRRRYFNTADDGCVHVRIHNGQLTAEAFTGAQ